MKKFFKAISMLLAVASMATVMSGCNKPAEEEGVPTLVWYMQKPVGDMSRQEEVEAAANEIIEPAIGAKVHFEFVDVAAWPQRKNLLISSGEEFDLIFDTGATFVANAEKGAYIDLTDYIDEYLPEVAARTEQFGWDAVTFRDGGIYAIPAETFYVPYTSFAFKADIVDKYNFDYMSVKTYEDLIPYLEDVKNNESGMYGMIRLPELQSTKYIPTTSDYVLFDVENDKFIAEIDSPDKIHFWKTVKDFVNKGYMPIDAAAKTDTNSEIKSGKYAMFTGQMSADKSTSRQGFRCYENEPQFGMISRNNVTNALTCVSATSKHPEKALQLINLIWEDRELSNLLAFGIEGKDYEVTANPGTDERFVDANNGNDVKWAIWHNWLGPLWDQWDSDWNSTESLVMRQEINASAEKSPIIGFLPDVSKFKTETSMLSSIRTECGEVLNTGSEPDFDEYYAQMKTRYEEAGVYELVDEFNKQYEDWKK